jgi:hypothetical protein
MTSTGPWALTDWSARRISFREHELGGSDHAAREPMTEDAADLGGRVDRIQKRIARATERVAEQAKPRGSVRSKMSVREKAAYVRDHGREAYLALPWQAR